MKKYLLLILCIVWSVGMSRLSAAVGTPLNLNADRTCLRSILVNPFSEDNLVIASLHNRAFWDDKRNLDQSVAVNPSKEAPPIKRTVYVDQQIAVGGDGSSWSQAYKTLSDALQSSASSTTVDSILVAAGAYYPTGLQSATDRDSSFLILRSGIKIYGGYPTGGGERNVVTNATVLSGNIGNPGDITDNSVHVLVIAGIDQDADSVVLDGLIFSAAAGSAIAASTKTYNGIAVLRTAGGGVNCTHNTNENIAFRNCTFSQNVLHSSVGGAGMYIESSAPLISGCSFASNSGNGSGGGIFNSAASPVIDNCQFSDNMIQGSGGAIYNNSNSNAVITNCTFSGNANSGTGGSAIFNNLSQPTIINCMFTNNQLSNLSLNNTGGAGVYNLFSPSVISHCSFVSNVSNGLGGAGIFNYTSAPVITDCLFSGNLAANGSGNGAGICNYFSSAPVITNCIFSGNYAGRNGGGLYNNGSSYSVTNCTFSGNFCATGGAIYSLNANAIPVINNTICWGNRGDAYGDIYTEGSTVSISYSDIESQAGGTFGNINADPLFVDRPEPSPFSFVGGDYHLQSGSPALDAGKNDLNTLSTDFDNDPRIVGAAIDMGAYESPLAPLPVTIIHFKGAVQDGWADLWWQTGVEINCSHFELEKSSDGSSFIKVATVTPKGSNSDYSYRLTQTENRCFYRLKTVDNNGKSAYGPVLTLTQKGRSKFLVYPNPATDHIQVETSKAGTLFIFDAGGRLVKRRECQEGTNTVSIKDLSAGIYYLQVGEEKMSFIKSK